MNTNCLDFEQLPDGNLKVLLTPEGREELEALIEDISDDCQDKIWRQPTENIWYELTESHWTNGSYEMLRPEDIGALTEAPIIGLDIARNDDNVVVLDDISRVWYYPDYMIKDELSELLDHGHLIFQKA